MAAWAAAWAPGRVVLGRAGRVEPVAPTAEGVPWHALEARDAAARLGTGPTGLSGPVACKPREILQARVYQGFRRKVSHILALSPHSLGRDSDSFH